mgnify:FL=1
MLPIVGCVLGERLFFAGDPVFLARPLTEVDQLATFAAKRPPTLLFDPFHLFAASRAGDEGAHIMQQVSLNGTS